MYYEWLPILASIHNYCFGVCYLNSLNLQIPGLQTYECSLEASVSSMSSGSSSETDGVVTLQDPPTHYCKTACVGGKKM